MSVIDAPVFFLGLFCHQAAKPLGQRCYELGAPILRQAALRGDVNAKYSFARLLLDGIGIERDAAEAARLLWEVVEDEKAVARPLALFCLGGMHVHGKGVRMNSAKAVEYFEASAQLGVAVAYNSLGWLSLHGVGVEKDPKKAVSYFEQGTAKDEPYSIHALAGCYIGGNGVEKDKAKAVELYEKAAAMGNPMSIHSLGVCYSVGDGVEMDLKRSVELWTKAARLGVPESQVNLGNLYATGNGVERDFKRARELLTKASFSRPEVQRHLAELDKEEARVAELERQ